MQADILHEHFRTVAPAFQTVQAHGAALSHACGMTGHTLKLRPLFSKYSLFPSPVHPVVTSLAQLAAAVARRCSGVAVRAELGQCA